MGQMKQLYTELQEAGWGKKEIEEFNEVCGFNPEMNIPTIIRNRQEALDQERVDQENAIIEEDQEL